MQDAFDVGDLPAFMTEPDPDNDSDTEDAILSTEQLIEKFKKRADNAHISCLQRRSKVVLEIYVSLLDASYAAFFLYILL